MDPLPQQRKEKKKGRTVVNLLRTVLLLSCCRDGASEHEEDQNEPRRTPQAWNPNGTRTPKQKHRRKSFFKKVFGLFTKRNGKTGQNERGGNDSGRNDGAEPSSQGAPPRRQTSTSDHESTSEWRLPGIPEEAPTQSSAENCEKVTSAPDLHEPRPGPSHHEDLDDYTVLFSVMDNVNRVPMVFSGCEEQGKSEKETVTPELPVPKAEPSHHEDLHDQNILFPGAMDKVNRGPMVFSGCEEQGKTERNTVTPELPEPKAGPSHLGDLQGSTITLPEKKSASSSKKLTKVPEEVAISIEDSSTATEETTTDLPTPSNLHLLCFSFSILVYHGVLIYLLIFVFSHLKM